MTLTDELSQALAGDDLQQALSIATQAVKAKPMDFQARMLLADTAVLCGDLERAETHAKMAANGAPEKAIGLGVFRQHLRGMHARAEWWRNGAVPVFPEGPSALSSHALEVNVALRAGDGDKARAALETLDAERGDRAVVIDGVTHSDFRDLDDRLPHAFEVITAGGNYMWLDFDTVRELKFQPIKRPLDMIYRPCRVTMARGSAADILVPAIYPDPLNAAQSLGRVTEFSQVAGGLSIAHGQRAWLAGDEMLAIMDIETLSFSENG